MYVLSLRITDSPIRAQLLESFIYTTFYKFITDFLEWKVI